MCLKLTRNCASLIKSNDASLYSELIKSPSKRLLQLSGRYAKYVLQMPVNLNCYKIYTQVVGGMSTSNKRKKIADDTAVATKKHTSGSGYWSQGLKAAVNDPALRIKEDDQCVIIKDKYPKARYHYLVLPKRSIANLKKLTPNDIPLLTHMYEMAEELVTELETGLEFRYGYHAVPSMSLLHLHVISQDFDSPCLKTKKHWNSFNTEYFISSSDIIEMLNEEGRVQLDTSKYEELLKHDLKCHVCSKPFSTMPALKTHLIQHISRSAKKPE